MSEFRHLVDKIIKVKNLISVVTKDVLKIEDCPCYDELPENERYEKLEEYQQEKREQVMQALKKSNIDATGNCKKSQF